MSECPHCHITLDLSQIPPGQVVSCPRCRNSFQTAGGPPVPPPPPPPDPPSSPTAGIQIKGAERFSNRFRDPGWQASTSFWDIFDWRFERYVTPWVVRATWAWLLFQAALMIVACLLLGFLMFVDTSPTPISRQVTRTERPAVGSGGRTTQVETIEDPGGWRFQAPDLGDKPSRTMEMIFTAALRVIVILSLILAVIFWLLWCRVMLESVIVIFNIAATLKSIEAAAEERVK